jgi:hypothetical protein
MRGTRPPKIRWRSMFVAFIRSGFGMRGLKLKGRRG